MDNISKLNQRVDISSKPFISTKEARKILGVCASNLSDEDLLQELYFWEKMAEIALKMPQVR